MHPPTSSLEMPHKLDLKDKQHTCLRKCAQIT
jgi:hypothetical protein